jgi:dephospho-CoA kinase
MSRARTGSPGRIGLAGYMGSGKSTVATFLASRGYRVIEADQEAKQLMQRDAAVLQALRRAFGDEACDGSSVRFERLAPIVFGDRDAMATLNRIVHPPLLGYLEQRIGGAGKVALDAALLPLWNNQGLFDALWWVEAPREERLERLARRTGLDRETLLTRMQLQESMVAQPPRPPWVAIVNDDGPEELEQAVAALLGDTTATAKG